mgnify:FL=1
MSDDTVYALRIAQRDAEIARLTVERDALASALQKCREALKAEVDGPAADHHPDDCPGECADCARDRRVNAALAALDTQAEGNA